MPVWRLYAGTVLGVWVFPLAGVGVWHASVGLAGSPWLARTLLINGLLAGLLAHATEIGSTVAHTAALGALNHDVPLRPAREHMPSSG